MAVINGGRSVANGKTKIYIGRGTVYGNPFRIGIDGTRSQVIEKYKIWFESNEVLKAECRKWLIGKTLVCHCAPLPCHGDVIAEYLSSFTHNLFEV